MFNLKLVQKTINFSRPLQPSISCICVVVPVEWDWKWNLQRHSHLSVFCVTFAIITIIRQKGSHSARLFSSSYEKYLQEKCLATSLFPFAKCVVFWKVDSGSFDSLTGQFIAPQSDFYQLWVTLHVRGLGYRAMKPRPWRRADRVVVCSNQQLYSSWRHILFGRLSQQSYFNGFRWVSASNLTATMTGLCCTGMRTNNFLSSSIILLYSSRSLKYISGLDANTDIFSVHFSGIIKLDVRTQT